MTVARRDDERTTSRVAWLGVASVGVALAMLGCDAKPPAETAPEPPVPATERAVPAVIDADWVASKFQAPPPPAQRDWTREIEKDPIAALKQMDPGALQAKRGGGATSNALPAKRVESEAEYDPGTPLRDWPPVVGRFYPNIILKDQTGHTVALSDFKGKVVLVELVGLTCKACHAFSGGNEPGTPQFRGITPQPNLPSIERFAKGYANVSLDHPEIVFVQLALYGMDGQSPPSEEDVRDWSRHFDLKTEQGEYVLVGDARFISPETRRLIPGFHLIDRSGVLRAMSSNDPRHDPLHSTLLPRLAELVR